MQVLHCREFLSTTHSGKSIWTASFLWFNEVSAVENVVIKSGFTATISGNQHLGNRSFFAWYWGSRGRQPCSQAFPSSSWWLVAVGTDGVSCSTADVTGFWQIEGLIHVVYLYSCTEARKTRWVSAERLVLLLPSRVGQKKLAQLILALSPPKQKLTECREMQL